MKTKWSGFSLVELMTVIVIIGILSTVAVPAYRKYILDVKIAESYSIMDNIAKSELAFFGDHAEFYSLSRNPGGIKDPMSIGVDGDWDRFGYAIAVGTNVYFQYLAEAGKIDETGTELMGLTGVTGGQFYQSSAINESHGSMDDGSLCNEDMQSTPVTFGLVVQPRLDWVIVSAYGDMDGNHDDGLCTGLQKLIQTDPANGIGPSASGFIIINKGS